MKLKNLIITICLLPSTLNFNRTLFFEEYLSFLDASLKSNTLSNIQKEKLKNIVIVNGMFNSEQIPGTCDPLDNQITVDLNFLRTMPPLIRQELVDHEMGHCILDRSHITGNVSVMHPFLTYYSYSSMVIMMNRRKELFSPEQYGSMIDEIHSRINSAKDNYFFNNQNYNTRLKRKISREMINPEIKVILSKTGLVQYKLVSSLPKPKKFTRYLC